jgi:hypothetical protein
MFVNFWAALAMIFIFATTLPTRQILMPAINVAADNEQKKRFKILHTASVVITLSHIIIAGLALCIFT